MTVKEFVVNENGQWLVEWIEKYLELEQIQISDLDNVKVDELMWKNRKGELGKFSVRQVYNDLKDEEGDAKWSKLVWFSQKILKHAKTINL